MKLNQFLIDNNLTKKNEIIFFGGSFNPWHKGHTSCIELATKKGPVIIVPDHNPFKEMTEFRDKLTSEKELIGIAKNHSCFLYLGFLKLNKPNPTYNWITEVKKKNPRLAVSLLMGFDTFMSLDKWYQAEKLLKLLDSIYIASRLDNNEVKELQQQQLKKIAPHLKIQFLGHHPHENISSTDFRNKN